MCNDCAKRYELKQKREKQNGRKNRKMSGESEGIITYNSCKACQQWLAP